MSAEYADPAVAARLVDHAAKEGGLGTSETAWNALKSFARRSDGHMVAVFVGVLEQLGAPHSQARCRALELCARLWPRSAAFRHALLRDVPGFVRLVYGRVGAAQDAATSLPPPERWAKQLRRRGAELICQWHGSHGHLPEYRHLDLARRHVVAPAGAGEAPALPTEPRAQRWRERWEQLRESSSAGLAEVETVLSQLQTCLDMIAPAMEDDALGGPGKVVTQWITASEAGLVAAGASGTAGPTCAERAGRGSSGAVAGAGVEGRWAMEGEEGSEVGSEVGEAEEDGEESGGCEAWEAWHGFPHAPPHPLSSPFPPGLSGVEIRLDQPEQPESDRRALTDTLRDSCREARARLMPMLRSWLATLTHVQISHEADRALHTRLLRRVAAARTALLKSVTSAEEFVGGTVARGEAGLGGGGSLAGGDGGGASDSDSDFEDVPLHPCTGAGEALAVRGRASGGAICSEPRVPRSPAAAARVAAALLAGGRGPACVDAEVGLENSTNCEVGLQTSAGLQNSTGPGNSTGNGRGLVRCEGPSEQPCGMPRRDGTRCVVPVPHGGACIFHGARCARGPDGVPLPSASRLAGAHPAATVPPAVAGASLPVCEVGGGAGASSGVSEAERAMGAFLAVTHAAIPDTRRCGLSSDLPSGRPAGPAGSALGCAGDTTGAAAAPLGRRARRSAAAVGALEEVVKQAKQPRLQARLGKRKAGVAERRAEASRQANATVRARHFNSTTSTWG